MTVTLIVFSYFIIIYGTGFTIARFLRLSPEFTSLTSFLIGSVIIVFTMSFLALGQLVKLPIITIFTVFFTCLTLFQIKPVFESIRTLFLQIFNYLYSDRSFSVSFSILFLILIICYFALAAAPPRSGDAMRYHLAQLKDIVQHQGFVFRPYFHYNFPMNFSMLFLPIYYFCTGSTMNLAHTTFFFISIFLTLNIARKIGVKSPKILVLLFLLTPISYSESHKVTNDWALICFVLLGFQFLGHYKYNVHSKRIYVYLGFVSLGLALGVKYHAILFLPWFILLTWDRVRNWETKSKVRLLVNSIFLLGLTASPWYLKNIIFLNNPIWPLFVEILPTGNDYLDLVAKFHASSLTGDHAFSQFIIIVKKYLINPSIPILIWLLTILAMRFSKSNRFRIKIGIVQFFGLWWIIQPNLEIRFSSYILPFAYLLICQLEEVLCIGKVKWLRHGYYAALFTCFSYGTVVLPFLSKDQFRYHWTGDLTKYHRKTRFYDIYQWLNKNLPEKSQLLIIVSAGQTYYSDLNYLRADPWSSGLIDWTQINNPTELRNKLKGLKIDYILYEEKDWSWCPGGMDMMQLLESVEQIDGIQRIWEKNVQIWYSKIRRKYGQSKVVLMEIQ